MVEDEYLIADTLRAALDMEGANVVGPFSNVADALQALNQGIKPDAALLDVNLNGERVYPLVDRLMADHVPMALTTGYDGSSIPPIYEHIHRLQKPVHLHELLDCIDNLLR